MSFRRSTSNNAVGKRCFSVMSFACVLVAGWFLFILYLVKFQVMEPSFQTPDPANPSMKDQAAKKRSGTMHVVFSTDCTFFQDWQTMLVFYSAMAVGQKGAITRIASGCDETKQATLVALYKKLFPKYHVHFTPDFKKDKKSGKKYDFYNKPYGVEHWLDHAEPAVSEHVVIAIIDPDMIFVRPVTTLVAGEDNILLLNPNKGRRKGITVSDSPEAQRWDETPQEIRRNHPAAQLYGLGAPWAGRPTREFNRTHVCGPHSPCLNTTAEFGERHYSVGPPYLVEKNDLVRLTRTWARFVPAVYERNPDLLAEMYAYSIAAAHEYLPHFTMMHYMVSNTQMRDEEGWKWVDDLGDDVCQPPVTLRPAEGKLGSVERTIYYPNRPMPTFVHYCQFFRIGELGFHKRRIEESILRCDFPLMVEPPTDIGTLRYKNRDGEIVKFTPEQARRNAFALCVAHRSLNGMLSYYKRHMCPLGQFNQTRSLNVIHWPNPKHKW